MMKLIEIEQISVADLEKFVLSFDEVTLFQHPSFRNAVKKTKNYEWHWVGVEHNGEIVGSLASYDIIDKAVGGMVSARRRMIFGGPLIKAPNEKMRDDCAAILLDAIKKVGKKSYFIEFRNLFDMSKYDAVFKSRGYQFEEHLNFLIDVTKGEDELLKQMSKPGRKMVKQSLKQGLVVSEPKNIAEIDAFYDLLAKSYADKGLPLADRSHFLACFTELKKNECRYLVAKNEEGRIVAGRVVLIAGPNMYDWYAASDPAFLDRRPNDLLVWSTLKMAIRLGLRTFDFGGAGRPNEKYGVRQFKEKFRGLRVNFGRYTLPVKPIRTALAKKGMKIIMKMRKTKTDKKTDDMIINKDNDAPELDKD